MRIKSSGRAEHFVEYRAWQSMKDRCYNPNNVGFKNYGGRGIRVCDEWRKSFAAFYAHMGDRPKDHSLDRIDNDRDYEPGNCRWASREIQNANKRTSIQLTLDGETKTSGQWERELGVDHQTLAKRYARGLRSRVGIVQPLPDELNRAKRVVRLDSVDDEKLKRHLGKSMPIHRWAELVGMSPITLGARLRSGWPLDRALTQPVGWSRRPKRKA